MFMEPSPNACISTHDLDADFACKWKVLDLGMHQECASSAADSYNHFDSCEYRNETYLLILNSTSFQNFKFYIVEQIYC